ncbi:MAG: hypothetical protein ABIR98_09030 [Usitatibacter sp.]
MRLLAAVFFLAFVLPASGADGRMYAVLSLVGDQLLISQRGVSTGSRLDRNTREFVRLAGPAFDHEALFAIEDAIKRSGKGVEVVLLGTNDPALFEAQRRVLDEEGSTQTLLSAVQAVAASASATHLILLSKYRGDARLRVADGHVGAGTLEGLGFYLDHTSRMRSAHTGEQSQGFIAPFAYMRLSLVELPGGKLLREENVTASTTVASQKSDATWQILTAEQKARILRGLIRREIDRVIPLLLAP